MWEPNPTVNIGGTDFTGETLSGAQITFGQNTYLGIPQPPYAVVSIIDTTGDGLTIDLSDLAYIEVDNSAGTGKKRLFTGYVSDFSVSMLSPEVAIYDLTLIGYTNLMVNRVLGQNYLDRLDGSGRWFGDLPRIRASFLIRAGTGIPIDSLTGTINALTGTIRDLPNRIGTVTTDPLGDGLAYLEVSPEATAFDLAADLASGLNARFWENRNGLINFANTGATSAVSHTLDEDSIIVTGLNGRTTNTELYNSIVLLRTSPDQPGTQDVLEIADDVTSQASYGVRILELPTSAAADSLLTDIATTYLAILKDPSNQISGMTIDLTVDGLGATDRNKLLDLDMLETMNFTGIPKAIFQPQDGSGLVVGWSWQIGQRTLNLTPDLVRIQ